MAPTKKVTTPTSDKTKRPRSASKEKITTPKAKITTPKADQKKQQSSETKRPRSASKEKTSTPKAKITSPKADQKKQQSSETKRPRSASKEKITTPKLKATSPKADQKKQQSSETKRPRSASKEKIATPKEQATTPKEKATTPKTDQKKKSTETKRARSPSKEKITTTPKADQTKQSTETKRSRSFSKRKNKKAKEETDATSSKKTDSEGTDKIKKRGRSKSREPDDEKKKVTEQLSEDNVEKRSPTMDMQVHRLRHLEYIPSPVLAMTASSSDDGYLAISRDDGSYELSMVSAIEEYKNQYAPRITPISKIAGSSLAVAHSLCWVQDTCVAAAPDGTLWVVNFAKSQLQYRLNSGGGGIFDLVTCKNSSLPIVAGACQDGSIRLWQVSNGKIQDPPLTTLPTAGAAVLSLAWRLVKRQDDSMETVLFAGVADGTIRKYSLRLNAEDDIYTVEKQSSVLRMTVESKGRRTPTKVWTMQILQDGTLIAGNSLGQVQFWNSETGTLLQSMTQTELKADVLQLVVNSDETKVFASGVDSRVNCYERLRDHAEEIASSTWKLTNAQRPHTHDIKAMAMVSASSDNSRRMETLTTAGVDTKLCSYVVSDFSKRRPQVWYPWPSMSPISTASNQILSMQRYDKVELYQLEKDYGQDKTVRTSSSTLVGTIAIETQSNLVASTLSPNGQWLALCNATSLFVFRLEFSDGLVEPQKVTLPKVLERLSVVAIHFHGNTLFVADSSNSIHIVDLEAESMPHSTITIQTKGKETLPIHSIHTSEDGNYLVTLSRLCENGIHVFKRKGSSYPHYWTIPSLAGERPAALTLIQNNQVAVATLTNQVYLFDLEKQKLSPWSEQHGFPIQRWPSDMTSRKDFPVRLTVNPSDPTQLFLASFGSFCVINLKEKMPKCCRIVPESHVRRRKRPRGNDSQSSPTTTLFQQPHRRHHNKTSQQQYRRDEDPNSPNCTICLHYNSMLYLDFVGPNQMVVVEQPWLRVISTFPEALQRRVYGVN